MSANDLPNTIDLDSIATEKQNPTTLNIDSISTLDMVRVINEQDQLVAKAVERVLPEIAKAIDIIAEHFKIGGRLFYIGAGTSGRLGILDSVECPPTFGVAANMVEGIIAGGYDAIFRAQEGAEDNEHLAEQDLKQRCFNKNDVLVGIAASGRTPYTIGGLKFAESIGATSISVVCSPNSPMEKSAQLTICVEPGPEVITGSTRLKAGTAQKLVLNMLSTGAMIKLGKVYGNLMVDVKSSNKKLEERAKRIVMQATYCDRVVAEKTLKEANGQAKLAILMILSNSSAEDALIKLTENDGYLSKALGSNK